MTNPAPLTLSDAWAQLAQDDGAPAYPGAPYTPGQLATFDQLCENWTGDTVAERTAYQVAQALVAFQVRPALVFGLVYAHEVALGDVPSVGLCQHCGRAIRLAPDQPEGADRPRRWIHVEHGGPDGMRTCPNSGNGQLLRRAEPVPYCQHCRAVGRVEWTQQAWGDAKDCSACGRHDFYYSIGD